MTTARSARRAELLPTVSLQRLLAVMLLVIAPHLLRLPHWEGLLVLALPLWRGVAARRNWPMPPLWLKLVITVAVFAGVFASYGRIWGLHAGVALLAAMLALKLTELRARRDVMVTVVLLYFVLLTHFLYSQEIWTIAYLLASTLAITAVLIDVQHAGARPPGLLLRKSGILLAQSLPLMLLMFVLFPRLPGPLWSLPDDAPTARSGLSDSMTPGDIARLALSDAIAFRVRFEGAAPDAAERYWRGPLLGDFDGRSWHAAPATRRDERPQVALQGARYVYEVTLEPSPSPWLLALDLPSPFLLPPRSALNGDYQLVASEPVRERLRYTLVSHPRYRLQEDLPPALRERSLALPAQGNPRARALAAQWRADAGSDDAAIIAAALRSFRREPYVYTLEPPALGADSIDQFLFETRRGFCEHYAGSFTFLMRAAGIPARVVTGYLGGEDNPFGDWMVVRQSDAHAWSEVWLAGRGWVRVDPTAAVSPERIEHRLGSGGGRVGADTSDPLLAWSVFSAELSAASDWIDARWNGLVLGYGDEQQRDFLSLFGIGDWQSMLLALTGAITVALGILALVLMRRTRAAPPDTAQRQWLCVLRYLQDLGFKPQPGEGPHDFAQRVAQNRPDLASAMRDVSQAYLQLRYAEDQSARPALSAAVRKLRAAS